MNASAAVELQVCSGQLQNTRLEAAKSGRAADEAKAAVNRLATMQRGSATRPTHYEAQRNVVFSMLFAFGSAKVSGQGLSGLLDEARTAPLVLLSGRTDGVADAPAESRISRDRAEAVRAFLVQSGVDPARIRTTWQPIGDHAADNTSEGGRRLNRRVEIEIYRFAPMTALADPGQS